MIKKLIFVFLCTLVLPIQASLAVTATLEPRSPADASQRYIHGKLQARMQNGKLHTSHGVVTTTLAVEIEDRRHVDSWFESPANADVTLIYSGERLVKVVIY